MRSIIREKSEVMISELNQITGGVIKDRDNKTLGPTVEEMLYKSVFYIHQGYPIYRHNTPRLQK